MLEESMMEAFWRLFFIISMNPTWDEQSLFPLNEQSEYKIISIESFLASCIEVLI